MAFLVTAATQLGPTLRGLRKLHKLTQADVARVSGLRQKTVSLLETAPHRCSVDSLVRYLAAVRGALSLEPLPQATTADRDSAW